MFSLLISVIIYWVIGYILSLYIHEFGHLITGLLCGWKFSRLTIGPINIYRNTDNKIKVEFEKNILCWFGMAATIPGEKKDSNIIIWRKILISGPLASLIFSLIFLICSLYLKSVMFLLFFLDSFAIGMINFIPMTIRSGLFYNDGMRYKRIKGNGREAQEEKEILCIIERYSVLGENAYISEDECQYLLSSDDYSFRYYGLFILYTSGKNNNRENAGIYLEKAEEIQDNVKKSVRMMFPLNDEVKN